MKTAYSAKLTETRQGGRDRIVFSPWDSYMGPTAQHTRCKNQPLLSHIVILKKPDTHNPTKCNYGKTEQNYKV